MLLGLASEVPPRPRTIRMTFWGCGRAHALVPLSDVTTELARGSSVHMDSVLGRTDMSLARSVRASLLYAIRCVSRKRCLRKLV